MYGISRLGLLGVLFAVVCSETPAQGISPERDVALTTYQKMADVLLREEVLPLIIDALPLEDRDFARAIPVDITLEADPYRTGIVARDQGNAITISAAFLIALDIASDATAFAVHTRRYQDLPEFATQYSAFVRQQWWEKSSNPARANMFSNHIGWPDAAARAYRNSPEYRALRLAIMRQSLAWMSAHYMGHLVLDRRDLRRKRSDARDWERKVDAFATDLAYEAGFSPMPPLTNTVFFVSVDHPNRDRSPQDWMCRATEVTQRGLDRIEAERRKDASQDKQTARPDLTPEKSQLGRIRKLYRCKSFS